MLLPKLTIYTDGACSGNPGKGGWGAILLYQIKDKTGQQKTLKKCISGSAEYTTNNQMEMTAVIEALKLLKKPCEIELFTDSKYVLEGSTKWLTGWIQKGWKGADKKPVKNQELWKELVKLYEIHTINWHWVKGHSSDILNNEVDALARKECGTI